MLNKKIKTIDEKNFDYMKKINKEGFKIKPPEEIKNYISLLKKKGIEIKMDDNSKRNFTNIYSLHIDKEGFKTGEFVEIQEGVIIGKNCRVGSYTFICNNVIIGGNVFIGQHVSFVNDKYPPSNGNWKMEKPTQIEDNVSIGSGSIILPSVKIGKGARVGAGSVVTKDVKEKSIVKGNPAK